MLARFLGLFVFAAMAAAIACAPSPTPVPRATGAPAATSAAMPTSAPGATSAPAAGSGAPIPYPNVQRKIVKNAQMQLTVENSDAALDRLTGIAIDTGGYIVSTRMFLEGGAKAASIAFAVPVDRFEDALRRVRAAALRVEQESASGQDVTDQYVDLQSQLKNLEATADRIREFLKKAQTVEEALKVNQQLSDVEKQIELIKGKMNFIDDRSAFSTITVDLHELHPTPTPTMTRTPTPTPAPVAWQPGQTFQKAIGAQTTLVQGLTDLVIWLGVVFLPYALVIGLVLWVIRRVVAPRTGPSSGGGVKNPTE